MEDAYYEVEKQVAKQELEDLQNSAEWASVIQMSQHSSHPIIN